MGIIRTSKHHIFTIVTFSMRARISLTVPFSWIRSFAIFSRVSRLWTWRISYTSSWKPGTSSFGSRSSFDSSSTVLAGFDGDRSALAWDSIFSRSSLSDSTNCCLVPPKPKNKIFFLTFCVLNFFFLMNHFQIV